MSAPDPVRQSNPKKPRRAAGADAVSAMRRQAVRTVLGLVLVLAVVDGVFGQRGLLSNMSTRRRIQERTASNEQLVRENDLFREDIRLLREDPATVEELARRDLGLIKDGELLIILRDTAGTATAPRKIPANASTR